MTLDQALARLQAMRNGTTWGVNERAGAGGRQFGVKMGDIRALAKAIKVDHALALELWAHGNRRESRRLDHAAGLRIVLDKLPHLP